MSNLIPILVRDMMRPLRMMERQMRMADEFFHQPSLFRMNPRLALEDEDRVIQDRNKFQVKIDVQNFKPEEIRVKTIGDNMVQIEAKHEEKQDDHGYISREFVRKFLIPKGHDLKGVVSSLSEDGILTITAPKKPEAIEAKEKPIPVQHIEAKKE